MFGFLGQFCLLCLWSSQRKLHAIWIGVRAPLKNPYDRDLIHNTRQEEQKPCLCFQQKCLMSRLVGAWERTPWMVVCSWVCRAQCMRIDLKMQARNLYCKDVEALHLSCRTTTAQVCIIRDRAFPRGSFWWLVVLCSSTMGTDLVPGRESESRNNPWGENIDLLPV